MFSSNLYKSFFIFLLFIIICFMAMVYSLYSVGSIAISENGTLESDILISSSGFVWPVPSSSTITSYFGYRNAPTSGASSYHNGIDIAAPAGTNIVAAFSGKVTYIGFNGGNGYTVSISNDTFSVKYGHVSPYFLVYVGQYVNKGDIIATVGPKNVYGVPNNPYKDSAGNPTNGATTGPHLHFSLKKDGESVNPMNYF